MYTLTIQRACSGLNLYVGVAPPPFPARKKFSIQELPHINVQWFRGGLVFKAHRCLYHSALGLRVKERRSHSRRREMAQDKSSSEPDAVSVHFGGWPRQALRGVISKVNFHQVCQLLTTISHKTAPRTGQSGAGITPRRAFCGSERRASGEGHA